MATYNTLDRSQLFRSGNVELSDLGISDGTTGQGLGLNDSGDIAFIDLLGVNEYDSINLLPLSSINEGTLALVNSTNTLYLYSSGWYKIALINNNPAITGGYSSTYNLAQDGTPLEITIIANDPEGLPLTWSYEVTSGSLTNNGGTTATVSNVDNVFTITPTTNSLYAGVFSLTFKASDGINISGVVSEFTLVFKIANSNKTSLLAKAINSRANNTLADTSTNNHTITPYGNIAQGTFSPYNSEKFSTYFDGATSYLNGSNSLTVIGNGDFTIEAWFYATSTTGVVLSNQDGGTDNNYFIFNCTPTNPNIQIRDGGGQAYAYGPNPIANQWNHFALTRNGNTYTFYTNGVAGTPVVISKTITSRTLILGGFLYTGYQGYISGYVRDLRVVKGSVVYTSNFTPPTEPLTAIANTSLLTCNSHNFIDASTNNISFNIVGYPKIKAFSPFDSLEYGSTVNGGSYYTDGSGDYATLPTNIFTLDGAYTFEAWIYPVGTWFWPLGTWNNGSGQWGFWTIPNDQGLWNGKRTFIYYGNYGSGEGAIGTAAGINRYAWNHVAWVRDASNNLKIFINGKSQTFDTPYNVGSVSLSASTTLTTAAAPGLGGSASYNGYNGYYAGTRLVTGSALYTTDFTPDLVPPTAVTGTQVLVNATNGGVIDYSSKKNLINLIGNATSSTVTTKNALSSMYFDGVGDYTTVEYSTTLFDWWSSDYTLEYWFNTPNLATCSYNDGGKLHSTLCSNNAPTTTENYWSFGPNASGQIQLRYWNGASILLNTTATVTTNTWNHIALVVSGTTITIYLNGTASATASISGTPLSGAVGLHFGVGNNSYYQGYIEDLRITKGLARYTANFTPPTEELKG